MPLYPYRCADCGTTADRQVPLAERDAPAPCPACDGALRRQYTASIGIRMGAEGLINHPALHNDGIGAVAPRRNRTVFGPQP